LYLPKPIIESGFFFVLASIVVGIAAYIFIKKRSNKKRDETGVATNTTVYFLGFVPPLPSVVYFSHGVDLSIELFSLAFVLTIYTATYNAKAIRSGIESVDSGREESASAMGLTQNTIIKISGATTSAKSGYTANH